jgi:ethylmalonyl-CoA mutase
VIRYAFHHLPKWNPINICSYHLQESSAEPVQEVAFTLANAVCVLDTVREAGGIPVQEFPQVVGRMAFFLNGGKKCTTPRRTSRLPSRAMRGPTAM